MRFRSENISKNVLKVPQIAMLCKYCLFYIIITLTPAISIINIAAPRTCPAV